MQFARAYVPFVRQIMDWHRFNKGGYGVSVDPYLSTDIATKHTIDVPQLQRAIQSLLARNEVLRTQFVLGEGALLYQVALDADSPLFRLRRYACSPNDAYASVMQENVAVPVADSVLFKACLVENANASYIRLYVHQLIADSRSLDVLKWELVGLYRSTINTSEKPPAQQYVTYKNHRLFEQHTADFAFIRGLLAPIDRQIIKSNRSSVSATLSATLRGLCSDKYHSFTHKPGHSYRSAIPISSAKVLSENLRLQRTRLFGVLLMAVARAYRTVGVEKRLLGITYNEGYSPQVSQTVGNYVGESFIDVDRLLEGGDDIAALEPLQHHLFKLYKYAIFNYNLYNIDESALHAHCVGFVDYSESDNDLPYSVDVPCFDAINTVHFDLEPVFCCYQDAIGINWRFNTNTFSNQQIISIDALFRAEVSRLIRQVESSIGRGATSAGQVVWSVEQGA